MISFTKILKTLYTTKQILKNKNQKDKSDNNDIEISDTVDVMIKLYLENLLHMTERLKKSSTWLLQKLWSNNIKSKRSNSNKYLTVVTKITGIMWVS